jgi:hypothetical protein
MHPLIEEAMKKAAIAWLAVPGAARYPVWCLWLDGSLYVVSGPGEQPAPGLADAPAIEVTARGDHGGRIVTWPAAVSRVEPGGEEWEQVVPQLAGKRLNAPGGAQETTSRWASDCLVARLTPTGDPTESGTALPADSQAAPPVPTPAARRTAKPFRLHRVRNSPDRDRS